MYPLIRYQSQGFLIQDTPTFDLDSQHLASGCTLGMISKRPLTTKPSRRNARPDLRSSSICYPAFADHHGSTKRLTSLQCCRETKTPRLVERVLGDRIPKEEELFVECRLVRGQSSNSSKMLGPHRLLTMLLLKGMQPSSMVSQNADWLARGIRCCLPITVCQIAQSSENTARASSLHRTEGQILDISDLDYPKVRAADDRWGLRCLSSSSLLLAREGEPPC